MACRRLRRARRRLSCDRGDLLDPRHPPTEGWPQSGRPADRLADRAAIVLRCSSSATPRRLLSCLAAALRPRAVPRHRAARRADHRRRSAAACSARPSAWASSTACTPAGATRDRRSTWLVSARTAKAHFRGRPLFRHFADECLDDYVRARRWSKNHGKLRLQHRPGDRIPDLPHHPARHDARHLPKLRGAGGRSSAARSSGRGAARAPAAAMKPEVPAAQGAGRAPVSRSSGRARRPADAASTMLSRCSSERFCFSRSSSSLMLISTPTMLGFTSSARRNHLSAFPRRSSCR